jgi:hypothetical protein
MDPEKSEPEIKVTDRRRFSFEGEPLDAADAEQESAADVESSELLRESMPLPPPTFEFLVLSLRWQAELQLGLYHTEKQPEHPPDLDGARHSIDLLGMLQEKTRGNLSLEEQRLLENSLTELRFRYVQAVDKFAQKK